MKQHVWTTEELAELDAMFAEIKAEIDTQFLSEQAMFCNLSQVFEALS